MAEIDKNSADAQNALKIAISESGKIEIIRIESIIYCKAEGSYCRIYAKKKEFVVTKNLGYFQSILPKNRFKRIHKSYLINIDFLTEILHNKTLILHSSIQLPIARRRKIDLINQLEDTFLHSKPSA
ncbi:MAG: hypothetical protein GT600_05415 [Bacteroidales bacterium]|jgi:two-component system LytT family response regulator|nr:hypothetical protein [Bacteroidales bacterium]NMD03083.1 LytTR family transcriptional regulator [Bacteroidales bacterium]OQB59129.1 MAG: LytTr DNA-binding domain protein [Bacteroidetes bacterium ADurb.Bin145]HQK69384.1 LytTR family DNA-binding domain-containing protein [Bacteroidales bacterium]